MWNFITQPAVATGVLDFTNEFSLMMAGFLGLVALSAGMIIFTAIRHSLAEKARRVSGATQTSADQHKAA